MRCLEAGLSKKHFRCDSLCQPVREHGNLNVLGRAHCRDEDMTILTVPPAPRFHPVDQADGSVQRTMTVACGSAGALGRPARHRRSLVLRRLHRGRALLGGEQAGRQGVASSIRPERTSESARLWVAEFHSPDMPACGFNHSPILALAIPLLQVKW